MAEGPRIYNLFPLLAGPLGEWPKHIGRIAEMGFNWIYVNPFHYPGFSGSLYAVKDYYELNPLLRGRSQKTSETLLKEFLAAARRRGIAVMMDLVVNHTARDSDLAAEHPEWFTREADGTIRSPGAVDPDDPNKVTVWGDLAEIDYSARPERQAIVECWKELVSYYTAIGFAGFRCDAAYKVPAEVWAEIIEAARIARPETVFFAETLGCKLEEVTALHDAGFDYLFNSAKWWDFEAPWLLEQYESFRHIAPSVAFPESHDTDRLAGELAAKGVNDPAEVEAHYRLRYAFGACFSTGVMMPMGYEYGFRKPLHVVDTRPEDWEEPLFDLSPFVREVNRLKRQTPTLNEEGPQERVTSTEEAILALLRRSADDGDDGAVFTVLNPDARHPHSLKTERLHGCVPDMALAEIGVDGKAEEPGADLTLPPLGLRVLEARRAEVRLAPARKRPARKAAPATQHPAWSADDHIVIEGVHPELDCGRFPVKREVGDSFEVWADIFRHGHDVLAAVVKYRTVDEKEWRETPMRFHDNDRWRGSFPLERNTRYLYTVEAWTDHFESWRSDTGKKRDAGQDVRLELAEGRALVEATLDRVKGDDRKRLQRVLKEFDSAGNDEDRAAVMMSTLLRQIMRRWPERDDTTTYRKELEVVVDRERARFAAWYEMFHRSQGTEPGRWATFKDCERRLPEIRDMGFDVVYLVPVHPIGRIHRKGPNNTLNAGPNDPGSPYAIGAAEGGHTAVHPELGTLEDFRHFVGACHAHGMEVALDIAIQCAPDHPWVEEHPEWFSFRPDGTIKYAENPPKKYQDIVNVNFQGPHREALWNEIRDMLLFWVEQGVRIFRVDNPHTKPVAFWEWVIREVQAKHPDVIFLSEAFTRPKMLQALAKAGFTQSYTYFTWRNFKPELTDYLVELTQSDVKEYLRPNFFTNTPDILPPFLQTGGRPAFMIRLVLAATLSSVYGIYNGFELCENTAIPGREEYLNSEKYDYKVWDWDRPGNIKDYIARVNRIRRDNPALHHLTNLRFYAAHDDDILFYGKVTQDRRNMVFVAVNLDPFEAHETTIEFPLHEMGVPENESFEVEELLTGAKHLWRGAHQHVSLDPQVNPAAIFRVTPWEHVDYREPCF